MFALKYDDDGDIRGYLHASDAQGFEKMCEAFLEAFPQYHIMRLSEGNKSYINKVRTHKIDLETGALIPKEPEGV